MLDGAFTSLALFTDFLKVWLNINSENTIRGMKISVFAILGFYFALCIYSAAVFIKVGRDSHYHFEFDS